MDSEPISPSTRDAERLVAALRSASHETTAAKIEEAMELHSSTQVELKIGEDEAVLRALEDLKATGDYLSPLARLERALRAKIDREGS